MKTAFIATLAGLAVLASAQTPALPPCVQTCIGGLLTTTGCSTTDFACICKSNGFIDNISCCISKECSPSEQTTVIQLGDTFCQPYGITLPTKAGCSASASATGTSASASASGTGSATGSVASAATTAAAGVSSSISGAIGSASASVSSAVASISSAAAEATSSVASAASSVSTGAAAIPTGFLSSGLGAAGAIAAAVALL